MVPNSGRGHVKGDAKLGNECRWLVDYKFNNKSFSLTNANWEKLRKEAWREELREPLISVVFEGGHKVAIIDWEMFMMMWQKMEGEK